MAMLKALPYFESISLILASNKRQANRISGSNSLKSPSNLAQKRSSSAANCWFKCVGAFLNRSVFSPIKYFVHVLLECNLFEMNISYVFRNIKALCQQPSAQLIITLNLAA